MFAIVYEKTNDSANTVTTQALKVLGKNICNIQGVTEFCFKNILDDSLIAKILQAL